jgi:hypothetical protein
MRLNKVNSELLGDDRPDLVEAFYAQEREWLNSGGPVSRALERDE